MVAPQPCKGGFGMGRLAKKIPFLSEISYETHSATEAREGVGAIDLPGLVSWHRNIISISVTSIIYYR